MKSFRVSAVNDTVFKSSSSSLVLTLSLMDDLSKSNSFIVFISILLTSS